MPQAQALRHQRNKEPQRYDILTTHKDGSVDLGLDGKLVISHCKVSTEPQPGTCTPIGLTKAEKAEATAAKKAASAAAKAAALAAGKPAPPEEPESPEDDKDEEGDGEAEEKAQS